MCNELVEEEPDAKWCLITKVILLRVLHIRGDTVKNSKNICNDIFNKLIKLDPTRQGYYKDMLKVVNESFN